jgi:hypothetical protein
MELKALKICDCYWAQLVVMSLISWTQTLLNFEYLRTCKVKSIFLSNIFFESIEDLIYF